jgi:hypothetical protein
MSSEKTTFQERLESHIDYRGSTYGAPVTLPEALSYFNGRKPFIAIINHLRNELNSEGEVQTKAISGYISNHDLSQPTQQTFEKYTSQARKLTSIRFWTVNGPLPSDSPLR